MHPVSLPISASHSNRSNETALRAHQNPRLTLASPTVWRTANITPDLALAGRSKRREGMLGPVGRDKGGMPANDNALAPR
jgi:hypothetical protein